MNYLIGDVQGCCTPLERLLEKIDFSPSKDHLYLLGDLVNRGPRSLDSLRLLHGLGNSASCLLGNHDLNLLAVSRGIRGTHRGDTIQEILDAPDRDAWLEWLSHQRMAIYEHGWLMVHAGVVPQWDRHETLRLAAEVESVLRSSELEQFLPALYGDEPAIWSETLTGAERTRFIVNVLTRTRFVAADGTLDLVTKDAAEKAPNGFYPWFDVPGRLTANTPIAFGHWASLGFIDRPHLLALDTGCVWGGRLTAARIDGGRREIIQVECS